MLAPVGRLPHDLPAGSRADAATFDDEGYAVGRQVLAPELLRELRAPLIEALVADGHVEPVDDDEDRFRWIGDEAAFDRAGYQLAMQADIEELLVRPGLATQAIEATWGRRPALWDRGVLFVMFPGAPTRVHRDGWQLMGHGGPDEHVNLWCPLTRLDEGDGALAFAVGSHRMADRPARVPMPYQIHQDVYANTGNRPDAGLLEPLWRTTPLAVGDALLFRPDIVHSTTPNSGGCLRLALGLGGQDARLPLMVKAGLTLDATRDLIDVEWLTLALMALQPTTPWLARCAFYSRGVIGRLWAEQPQELVERAFATLRARDLIEPHEPYDEERGAIHHYHHATPRGRRDAAAWLSAPSRGDDRLLAVKLLFCGWLGLDAGGLLAR